MTVPDDLKTGTVIYVEMDRKDGLVLNKGYNERLKYVVIAGAKSNKKEFLLVLINSENDYSDIQDWKANQYPLLLSNYNDFLVNIEPHIKKVYAINRFVGK